MNIFRRPDYRSETTQFLTQLKTSEPKLASQQRQGLSLLWNKIVDRDAVNDFRKARVAQKPYVYQTDNE